MKKFILLITIAMFGLSCSNDSDSPSSTPLPTIPVATKVTFSGIALPDGGVVDVVYTFSYDNQRRLASFSGTSGTSSYTGTLSYDFAGMVTKVEWTGDTTGTSSFAYNAHHYLTAFEDHVGNNNDFSYADGTYLTYFTGGYNFMYLDNGDLHMWNAYTYNYNTAMKGAFANVNGQFGFLPTLIDGYFAFFMTKAPLVSESDDSTAYYTFINSYNSDGMVDSAVSNLFYNLMTVEYTKVY